MSNLPTCHLFGAVESRSALATLVTGRSAFGPLAICDLPSAAKPAGGCGWLLCGPLRCCFFAGLTGLAGLI